MSADYRLVRTGLSLTVIAAMGAMAASPASAAPKPRFAQSVLLAPTKGRVLVDRAGPGRAVRLRKPAVVGLGAMVDTSHGTVKLTSALPNGKTQFGTFTDGAFVVTQSRRAHGLTDLTLAGGDFASCPTANAAGSPTITAAVRPRRRLFGHAHGRFRTRGRNSTATVRGTKWMTEDRCDGTHTTDRQGKVDTDTGGKLKVQLDPGETATYYCNPRADPPGPGTYCLYLLAKPAEGLAGAGIIDITDETQYDLCVTYPDAHETCGSLPFSQANSRGFRQSAYACYTDGGTGIYTVRWRVGGVFLFPPLTTPLTALRGPPPGPCAHKP
ncbi:MAG: hypothetical protein QOJ31_758 [Gaiellales bacterium]|jgi:hypothetical protein|nr:hypothetical protein [Gaiellales bacterium]